MEVALRCAPRRPSGWDAGGDERRTAHLGRVRAEHLVSELRRPGEDSGLRPNRVCAFVESPKT